MDIFHPDTQGQRGLIWCWEYFHLGVNKLYVLKIIDEFIEFKSCAFITDKLLLMQIKLLLDLLISPVNHICVFL